MDSVTGGSIATDGVVKLIIDTAKIGYIILPNGTVLTTVAGVINTIYTGAGGSIGIYFPKNIETVNLTGCQISGDIVYSGYSAINISGTPATGFTSTSSPQIAMFAADYVSKLVSPKVILLDARSCSLSRKYIGDVLYAAYQDNRAGINFLLTGGSNAIQSEVDTYLQATYGVTYATVYALLVTTNLGTILIDTV